LKQDSSYQAVLHPNAGTFFEIGFNTINEPFSDKRVRQAMNYAMDRKRFVDVILKGNGMPSSLPWTQTSPAYDANKNATYTYDLNKARSLLQDAGVENLETDILVYGASQPQLLQFTQIYQASLEQIGVKLNIKNVQQSVWLDLVINKKPEYTGFWAASDGFANVQPGSLFTLSPGWRAVNNHSAFQNDTWSNFIRSVSTETDSAKQQQLYQQLNDYMLDESFTMPISTSPIGVVTNGKVHGVQYLLHNTALSFTGAWMDA
jgi:peptide/nickel transport system substrate-binding protein